MAGASSRVGRALLVLRVIQWGGSLAGPVGVGFGIAVSWAVSAAASALLFGTSLGPLALELAVATLLSATAETPRFAALAGHKILFGTSLGPLALELAVATLLSATADTPAFASMAACKTSGGIFSSLSTCIGWPSSGLYLERSQFAWQG